MRVAMISEHASPLAVLGTVDAGGQNVHVAELARALARRGHEVRVYTRRDDAALPDAVPFAEGVTVHHVPAGPPAALPKDALRPHMAAFGAYLAAQWTDGAWAPEVIHAHFWMSGLAAVRAGRACGVPVVQTFHALGSVKRRHQGDADTSPDGRIEDERMLCRRVDRVVAQCRDEIAELEAMDLPRQKVCLIPSGVDTRRFAPKAPPLFRRPGPPRIVSVGRLVERKGHADMIRALVDVPDAEYLVIGGPPAGGLHGDPVAVRLRELARELGVDRRVRLVGQVPSHEMPDWYATADLLVCPPWYEPFGLTLLEAMACGKPVVATAVGGHTDTVVDGVTGELVPPRDPAALARVVRDLLADHHRRAAYGRASLRRVHEQYTWARRAEQIETMYHTVAHSRKLAEVAV
ncbi:MAG TPA: glycosyltransferase [Pilimelia sp.]|nr:glycosyltransferase [Pilimelia sp.]